MVCQLVRPASKDALLDDSTVPDSLADIDRFLQLLPVEVVVQKLDNIRNPGRHTNNDNHVDSLIKRRIMKSTLDLRDRLLEQLNGQLLMLHMQDRHVEVNAVVQSDIIQRVRA